MKKAKKILRDLFVMPSGIFLCGLFAGEIIGKSKFVPWSMLSTTEIVTWVGCAVIGALSVYVNHGMLMEYRRLERFLDDGEDG